MQTETNLVFWGKHASLRTQLVPQVFFAFGRNVVRIEQTRYKYDVQIYPVTVV